MFRWSFSDGNGTAFLFGSYHGDCADLPRIHTAHIDAHIDALSDTILPDEGSLVEMGTGYKIFWSGLPKVARRIHGVGFAAMTALLLSTQESPIAIMKMRDF